MKRFSLASLLLMAAVVALAVALLNTSFHLANARAELAKLRNDIRLLDPSQPDKMRAIEIPAFGSSQWRWRIDLPDNEQYVLRWAYDDIPADDSLPPTAETMFIPPELPQDEFILNIAAYQENERWMLGVSTKSESRSHEMDFGTELKGEDSSWLGRSGNSIHRTVGTRETSFNPPDQPFILLRYRKGLSPSNGVSAMDPNPTDGLMIWIERASVAKQGTKRRNFVTYFVVRKSDKKMERQNDCSFGRNSPV